MSFLLALVLAGGGLGAGGLQPPSGGGAASSTALNFDGGAVIATSVTTPFLDAGTVLVTTLSIGNGSTETDSSGTALFSAALKSTGNTTANAFIAQGGGTTCFACASTSSMSAGSKVRGAITLSTGSGTATVDTGAFCVCTDTTANASVKCAVASTTLTATGTGSDVINYVCVN